jgi:hypothetical protein
MNTLEITTMTDKIEEFSDVCDDRLTITTGSDVIGSDSGALAEFRILGDTDQHVMPWCPNAIQLLALRDRCSAILGLVVDTDVDERLTITLDENVPLSEFNQSASGQQNLQDALDSLSDGVVTDKAGNLCLTSGEAVAVAEPDRIIWLQRIAAIINAVVEARSGIT